jgi:hypothetical protein
MTLISERLTTPLQFEQPREIKASLQDQLAASRTQELQLGRLAVGIPL